MCRLPGAMQVPLIFFLRNMAMLWHLADCFVPTSICSMSRCQYSNDSSKLFGIRSELRRRLSTVFRKDLPNANETLDFHGLSDADAQFEEVADLKYYPASLGVAPKPAIPFASDQESEALMVTTLQLVQQEIVVVEEVKEDCKLLPHLDRISVTNSATLSRAKTAASTSHVSLYSLPLMNRDLSKLEEEFRAMIEHFANYSEADLLSIPDPRVRAIFEGVAASAHVAPVYRAFEILFEDLLPLRMAGRLVFTKLKQFMANAVEQRKEEIQRVVHQTGLYEDNRQIEEVRLMFVSTASQLNGNSYLTLEQLRKTGIISATATEVLRFDNADQLLEQLDTARTGRLTFIDLMSGLWDCANEMCGLESCNPHVVLHNVLVELNEHPPPPADLNGRLDAARRKYDARYDEMVANFIKWKDFLPPVPTGGSTENRRMEVVRGCFVGAENQKVVDALRVVYVDYAGLRIAGDIIYKLASSLLNRR